jgi:hypothetical protein
MPGQLLNAFECYLRHSRIFHGRRHRIRLNVEQVLLADLPAPVLSFSYFAGEGTRIVGRGFLGPSGSPPPSSKRRSREMVSVDLLTARMDDPRLSKEEATDLAIQVYVQFVIGHRIS